MNKTEKTLLENRLFKLKIFASNILKIKKSDRTSYQSQELIEKQNSIKIIKRWLKE